MKTKLTHLATGLIAMMSFAGCANNGASTSTRPYFDTEKKVYSKEELDKRGRQTAGEDLAAQDPSVTLGRGR